MTFTRRRLLSAAALPGLRAFAQSPGLTREAADFILATRYESIPADVIELGRKSILDGLGLALCGSAADSGNLVRAHSTVIGSPLKVAPRFAAFANGVAMHADDYDDTQLAVAEDRVYGLLTHPTTTALPAALALAEAGGKSGRDLLLAYHVGVEVECKIAEAIAPRHYDGGFHSTGTCGTFG